MEKQKNTQLLIIAVLAVTVLTMSVGFAYYTATLNITGNTVIEAASWKVQFKDGSYSETTGDGYVSATSHTLGVTDLSFDLDLDLGEKYEFNAVIENKGTIDAVLDSVTLSSVPTELQNILTYKVFYNGTEMTAGTGKNIALDHGTSGTATVKVQVEYVAPSDPTNLPETGATVSLNASFGYKSKVDYGNN